MAGVRCTAAALCALALALPGPSALAADPYPTRPIRLILSSPPGGAVDLVARTLAARLSEIFRQQVIADNRPGGGQVIGTAIAAKADPDGYTLVLVSITHAINPGLGLRLPYDTGRDFSPVSLVARSPLLLVANPALGARSVNDLIRLASTRPGDLNYAGSNASGGHLAMELLLGMTNIRIVHVPYNGAAPALIDLVAGRVHVMMTSPLAAEPHVKNGKLVMLGISSRSRSPALPDVPAIAETMPGYEASLWYALLGPRGLPAPTASRLNTATREALATPAVRRFFAGRGVEAEYSTPADLSALISSEIRRWREVIRTAGIRRD